MAGLTLTLLMLAAPPQEGVASEVAQLLTERCAACHSAESDQPRARRKWGDAADLAATASNPKLIVPGNLEESELYQVIDFGEMPPPDSDIAPLNAEQKALLASWIEAGAPPPAPPPEAPTAPPEDHVAGERAEEGGGSAFMRWVSHFHPLIIHFPLGLLSAAFLAELLARVRPTWKTESAASFCLGLGALSAVPSAGLGWLLAESLSRSGSDLELHRWLGVSTALLSLAIWWASHRYPARRLLLLFVLAAIVGATGHTGGVLSYGADWLKPPF